MSRQFKRQNWWKHKRLGEQWRRPKGKDSKMRLGIKGKPAVVSIGYRTKKSERNKHPSGRYEVLVRNLKDLERADPGKNVVRIAASVGKRLRNSILEKAKERGLKVVNPGVRR